jgi:hypothetical protein
VMLPFEFENFLLTFLQQQNSVIPVKTGIQRK